MSTQEVVFPNGRQIDLSLAPTLTLVPDAVALSALASDAIAEQGRVTPFSGWKQLSFARAVNWASQTEECMMRESDRLLEFRYIYLERPIAHSYRFYPSGRILSADHH